MNTLYHPVVFQTEPSPSNKSQLYQATKKKLATKQSSPKPLKSFSPISFSVGNSFIMPNLDDKSFKTAVIHLNTRTKTPNPNSTRNKKTAPTTPLNQSKSPKVGVVLDISNIKRVQNIKESLLDGLSSTRDYGLATSKMARQRSVLDVSSAGTKDRLTAELQTPKEGTPDKKRETPEEKKKLKILTLEKSSFELRHSKSKDKLSTRKSSSKRDRDRLSSKDKKTPTKSKSKGRNKNGISTYCFESQTDLERINTELNLDIKIKSPKKKGNKDDFELEKLKVQKIQDEALIKKLQGEITLLQDLLKGNTSSHTPVTMDTQTQETSTYNSESLPMNNERIGTQIIEPSQKEVELLKAQNETLKITIDFLKNENQLLKDAKKQSLLYKEAAKKYKELAELRTKDYYSQNEDALNFGRGTPGMTPKSSILRLYYDSPNPNQRVDEWPSKIGNLQTQNDDKSSFDRPLVKSIESITSGTDYKILDALEGRTEDSSKIPQPQNLPSKPEA